MPLPYYCLAQPPKLSTVLTRVRIRIRDPKNNASAIKACALPTETLPQDSYGWTPALMPPDTTTRTNLKIYFVLGTPYYPRIASTEAFRGSICSQ